MPVPPRASCHRNGIAGPTYERHLGTKSRLVLLPQNSRLQQPIETCGLVMLPILAFPSHKTTGMAKSAKTASLQDVHHIVRSASGADL